jgi:hypothetical protein
MALPKQNLGRKKKSKRGCLVLFSTIFNISDLLVDKYVNSYQKSSEGRQVMSTS